MCLHLFKHKDKQSNVLCLTASRLLVRTTVVTTRTQGHCCLFGVTSRLCQRIHLSNFCKFDRRNNAYHALKNVHGSKKLSLSWGIFVKADLSGGAHDHHVGSHGDAAETSNTTTSGPSLERLVLSGQDHVLVCTGSFATKNKGHRYERSMDAY